MVVCSVIYAIDDINQEDWNKIEDHKGDTLGSIGVFMIAVYFASYLIPMFFNIRRLKLMDFIKGCIYTIYLAPTYVNILTIFSISNIHDVTWGSRPS